VTAGPERLGRLLRPRSVAFVGGSVASQALAECEAAGFDGPIWAVHATRRQIAGRAAVRSVAELPEPPDAAFVAVNAAATVEIVHELAELGAGGAICYAAGFAETGKEEGVARERELRVAARKMPVLGPNCYGLLDLVGGASLWPVPYPHGRRERGVAVVLQSGNLGINVTMNQRSLPLAFLASVGNQSVVDIADVIDAYLDMPETTAIGVYLEGLRDVPRFAAVAARALERAIPIAVCKAGVSERGRRLAYTHTASLAGSDQLYEVLFDRYGVARADTIPALLETLKALAVLGPTGGRRAFVFTCSGAECALAADAASASELELPEPTDPVRAELTGLLDEHALVGNPLDYGNALWGQEEPLRRVFSAALRDPADAAALIIDYPLPGMAYEGDVDAAIRALCSATQERRVPAALISVLPESFPEPARRAVLAAGACPLQGVDEGLAALAACARLGERMHQERPPPYPPVLEPPRTAEPLSDRAAREWLERAGVPVPEGRLVRPAEAPAAASELGFPVVAKLASSAIPHKADAGAIAHGLHHEAEVEAAVAAMLARNRGAPLDGVVVERLVTGAVCELLVGVRHDPAFGNVLLVGSGGTDVELYADTIALLLPLRRPEVEAALQRLRAWPRLARGDVAAAVEAVLAIGQLAGRDAGRFSECEINPLLVLERGAIAVDVLAVGAA
jgi:acetate---CoA ligase (ADP-forming)